MRPNDVEPSGAVRIERRALLGGALAALLAPWLGGCGPTPGPVVPSGPPLPPLRTSPMSGLVAAAGLRWVLFASPRDLLGVPWIPPLVDVAVSGARFDRFAKATGIDLRAIPEAIVASCAPLGAARGAGVASGGVSGGASGGSGAGGGEGVSGGTPGGSTGVGAGGGAAGGPGTGTETPRSVEDVTFYLVRHGSDAGLVERAFRARLTGGEKRSVDRPDLVRVSGSVGQAKQAAVMIGAEIAGFQDGGSMSRGPARIAGLFAEGKLQKASPALAGEPLKSLAARLGKAEITAFAPGPFDGDVARGLRGLLGAATAVGAAARPTFRQSFQVTIAVAGDFSTSAAPASQELRNAWNELAGSALGHLLGLDQPVTAPLVLPAPDAVMLSVELSGRLLAEGLAKATASKVEDIFR